PALNLKSLSLSLFAFLGEGGFGIVAKCRDTMTNRAVAIKVNKSLCSLQNVLCYRESEQELPVWSLSLRPPW
uniref:Protein kinase domain-containing protein n=1 Tax=Maylandia zebra TaxID=106582 RepID=A0A3P9DJV6_9CICH